MSFHFARSEEWALGRGGAARMLDCLCRDSETFPVFDRVERTERYLDSRCVVPADMRIEDLNEVINGRRPPVTRIKQFRLEPPEETLTGCISGEHPLRDIERTSPASFIRDSHSGQR